MDYLINKLGYEKASALNASEDTIFAIAVNGADIRVESKAQPNQQAAITVMNILYSEEELLAKTLHGVHSYDLSDDKFALIISGENENPEEWKSTLNNDFSALCELIDDTSQLEDTVESIRVNVEAYMDKIKNEVEAEVESEEKAKEKAKAETIAAIVEKSWTDPAGAARDIYGEV